MKMNVHSYFRCIFQAESVFKETCLKQDNFKKDPAAHGKGALSMWVNLVPFVKGTLLDPRLNDPATDQGN